MGEVTEKVFEYIDALASNLGVASEHVYKLLVKQQYISGVTKIIIAIVLIAIVLTVLKVVIPKLLKVRREKIEKSRWNDGDAEFFAICGISTVLLIIGAIAIDLTSSGVGALINPEYYAIKNILEVFR